MAYSPQLRKTVAELMTASGDVKNPLDETVECMCGLLEQYLDDTLLQAQRVALIKGGFDSECLLIVCGNDKSTYKATKSKLERRRALKSEIERDLTK